MSRPRRESKKPSHYPIESCFQTGSKEKKFSVSDLVNQSQNSPLKMTKKDNGVEVPEVEVTLCKNVDKEQNSPCTGEVNGMLCCKGLLMIWLGYKRLSMVTINALLI